jgi:uncharacterized protein (DUF983 family)
MSATQPRFRPRAIWNLRCPACGEGQVFRGAFSMNEHCPRCGYKFERGPGYFTGAMYFSYAMGMPLIAAFMGIGYLVRPDIPLHWLFLAAWLLFLPFVPVVFRYSRVLFMHFDRYFDPEG